MCNVLSFEVCFENKNRVLTYKENFDKPSSGSQPRSSFYNYLLYLCAVHFRYKVAARQSKALLDRLIRKAGGCRGVPILFYNLKGDVFSFDAFFYKLKEKKSRC